MVHLAQLLSPYGKWRGPFAADLPTIGAIDPLRVSATLDDLLEAVRRRLADGRIEEDARRSEEHTSELQSLMRISYAVFCLKKKNTPNIHKYYRQTKKKP